MVLDEAFQTRWFQTTYAHRRCYVADLDGVPDLARAIAIDSQTKNLERLLDLPKLEEVTLNCGGWKTIELALRLTNLKRLRLIRTRIDNLGLLAHLTELRELSLWLEPNIEDLTPLSTLPKLRALDLEKLSRLVTLESVRALPALEALIVSGSLSSRQAIDSLDPLLSMKSLKALGLLNIELMRGDISPVASMRWLEEVSIRPAHFSKKEYARIKVALRATKGAQFEPFYESVMNRLFYRCWKPFAFVKKGDPKTEIVLRRWTSEFQEALTAALEEGFGHA